MFGAPVQHRRSVLISGASIAGLTLAYWLDRYGFEVTVVEHAPAVRSGGYPVDIRGTAVEVIERMGLSAPVAAAHIASRTVTFVDSGGKVIGTLPIYVVTGDEAERDVELPRGTLTSLIYGRTRSSRVRYRFAESIVALEDDGAGVNVRFNSGEQERYGVVLGADGLHSHTRRLVFGPETPFSHYLGSTFSLFSTPNDMGLSHGAMIYADVGRAAIVMAVRNSAELFVMLTFAMQTPPFGARPNKAKQIQQTASHFDDAGWRMPRLLDGMRSAADLYSDTVSQIRMPNWSKGRVALVGDAAFAPSFRSGQGTSLALVGAYVLAGELAAYKDPVEAFAAYEQTLRPFIEANQALATKTDGDFLLPRTQADLNARNNWLAKPNALASGKVGSDHARAVHNALTLPNYDQDSGNRPDLAQRLVGEGAAQRTAP